MTAVEPMVSSQSFDLMSFAIVGTIIIAVVFGLLFMAGEWFEKHRKDVNRRVPRAGSTYRAGFEPMRTKRKRVRKARRDRRNWRNNMERGMW